VKWIDIVSPGLRAVHQAWCGLRGRNLIPHLSQYNRFLPSLEDRLSMCAVFPANGAPPAFRSIGSGLASRFPDVHAGTRFTDIRSVVIRTAITVPFHEVCASHQPDCRRGSVGTGAGAAAYEQLLMPFADDRLRVCLVHALFAFAANR
jgi:hypothetical protein